jgi:hypothetical protein
MDSPEAAREWLSFFGVGYHSIIKALATVCEVGLQDEIRVLAELAEVDTAAFENALNFAQTLSFGKPDEVRAFCRKVLQEVAANGGYIMDAVAIMQDDTSIENLRTLTQTTRECGSYAAGTYKLCLATAPCDLASSVTDRQKLTGMAKLPQPNVRPGVCFSWEQRVKELPEITGSPELIQTIWEDIDAFGNMYIWQLLLSF